MEQEEGDWFEMGGINGTVQYNSPDKFSSRLFSKTSGQHFHWKTTKYPDKFAILRSKGRLINTI